MSARRRARVALSRSLRRAFASTVDLVNLLGKSLVCVRWAHM